MAVCEYQSPDAEPSVTDPFDVLWDQILRQGWSATLDGAPSAHQRKGCAAAPARQVCEMDRQRRAKLRRG